jgi:hypothetical protein
VITPARPCLAHCGRLPDDGDVRFRAVEEAAGGPKGGVELEDSSENQVEKELGGGGHGERRSGLQPGGARLDLSAIEEGGERGGGSQDVCPSMGLAGLSGWPAATSPRRGAGRVSPVGAV